MIFWVEYDTTTGAIAALGGGPSEPTELAPSYDYLLVDTVLAAEDLKKKCVDVGTQELIDKPTITLTVLGGTTPADGVTEAVVSNIPVGTLCTFYVNEEPNSVEVNDGTFELALITPQTVTVSFFHPLYQMSPVSLEFV